ncbi:MAG TPA: type I DNA topoisomerase [Firmicutes bacterium]|nr:type I DNA topoisomerase [Bacillota bacterium]
MAKKNEKNENLVIVESPAKAKTIERYLGPNFQVIASMGHIIDLPSNDFGVNVDNNFEPNYVVIKGKEETIKKIKDTAKDKQNIYLAADPDREGEMICWHIAKILDTKGSKYKIKRILFNEITKDAIKSAVDHPSEIDLKKVYSQQTRRILDRIVGYKLSPLLWRKVKKKLSAGRVQSVALKLIVDRENEINDFVPKEYWNIKALFDISEKELEGKLDKIDGKKVEIKSEAEVSVVKVELLSSDFFISDIQKKKKTKKTPPPMITSTLQQDASTRYKFTPTKTMKTAQELYEGISINGESIGLITYMRTDSTHISSAAGDAVRNYIETKYGKDYLPAKLKVYSNKKHSQEAHEAIRPTSMEMEPDKIKKFLTKDQQKIYGLIWERFVISQMKDAQYYVTEIDIQDKAKMKYLFKITGQVLSYDGFYKVAKQEEKEKVLPEIKKTDTVKLKDLETEQKFTEPPSRFTIASLIKTLEKEGVGRPSTYASIINTIQKRTYVVYNEVKFNPTKLGNLVNGLLVEFFPEIIDIKFTSKMEESLDLIEQGQTEWLEVIKPFYQQFLQELGKASREMKYMKNQLMEKLDRNCPKCGSELVMREGKFGKFISCSRYPDCKYTESALDDKGKTLTCEKCGGRMLLKLSKHGRFYACSNYPECKNILPYSTGVKCPKEGCDGELLEKKSQKGKYYYRCSKYPDCDFVVFNYPIESKCPKCNFPILTRKVYKGNVYINCPNEKCDFKVIKKKK